MDETYPVMFSIPLGDGGEVAFMAALEAVVNTYSRPSFQQPLDELAVARSVDWLHVKYGSQAVKLKREV